MDRQSIECQICSNNCDADKPAQYPKFLPCGYTLCAGCIDKLIANSRETTLQCPVCIEATPKKPSNAAQLKNNYTLMSLLGSHESGVVKPTTSVSVFQYYAIKCLETTQPFLFRNFNF